MDSISRQAAIEVVKEFKHGAKEWKDEQEADSDIWHRADSAIASAIEIGLRIKAIPSAQPEQQWTPCSEGLPKKTDFYLVTVKDWNIPQQTDFFNSHDKKWDTFGDRVIAWQPLPEPYEET